MGTETILGKNNIVIYLMSEVKLNNPQMGTETKGAIMKVYNFDSLCVKLNNPQMGTETVKY